MYVLLLVLLSPNGTLSPMSAEFDDYSACNKAIDRMTSSLTTNDGDRKVIYSANCVQKKGGYR